MLSVYASATYKSKKSAAFAEKISAKASALYEPEEGRFIYEKNGDQRMPMASTTKIMTAIVVSKHCETDEVVIIGPESVGIEGSSAYLREGDEYTVLELLYALLLQSANDAATALAYYTAGGIEEFAELMNEEAMSLKLENTHFTNPHGLDDEDHYTTAKDLARVGAELMENTILKEIVSTYKKTFTYGERVRTYINHNKLLRLYEGGIGIKTGFTKRSGRCLVGAAERDGMTFISVTLDAPSDWSDHRVMLDFAFDNFERIELCGKGDLIREVTVLDGNKSSVKISAKENLSIIKETSENDIDEYLSMPRYLIAPIKEGEVVGAAYYKVGDKTYKVDLVALEDIRKASRDGIFTKILNKILR
jgi:D-alanyl-D-alanine carboxypeptidase/D-alanyl-D-alanine carboxypeptidase (penicillin-binding protein 5/6)